MPQPSGTFRVLLYAIGILAAILTIAPLLWLFLLALKTPLDAFAYPPVFIFEPTLENFRSVFSDATFVKAIRNSSIVSVSSVLIALALALPATFGLSNLRGRFRKFALLWILILRTLPGMIYLIPYFIVYNRLDLLDTHFGLILIYTVFNVPLVIWMLLPIWNSVPREISEAARLDGASLFQTMVHVEIPMIKSGIVAASILVFIFSWNEFLFALILTRRETVTLPVAIVNFMAYEGTEWGKIAAAAIVIMLPVVMFGFLIRRYMISGLAAGAVKG